MLCRGVNDRILELSDTGAVSSPLEILCECGRECTERITVEQEEYRHVRTDPTQFFVRVGHEVPEVEEVRIRRDGWMVVANIGVAGEIAKNA